MLGQAGVFPSLLVPFVKLIAAYGKIIMDVVNAVYQLLGEAPINLAHRTVRPT